MIHSKRLNAMPIFLLGLVLAAYSTSAFRLPALTHRNHAMNIPHRASFILKAKEQQNLMEKKRTGAESQGTTFPGTKFEFNADDEVDQEESSSFSYAVFAQEYPFANNVMIAATKTAAADFLAQTVVAQTPLDAVDWQRTLLFCIFGASYLGGFQYLYQVNIFKKIFDVEKFVNQSWSDKIQDTEGLKALAAQTVLDLGVLTAIYLPTFYIFKASVFSGSLDPSVWASTGLGNYQSNFAKDEFDLLRVWFPADLICFSVPLYLRLPARHVVSFVWTIYLSFSRGGH